MTSVPKVWGDALRLLQDEIPDFAFEAWIAPLAVKLSDAGIVLGSPTSFHRERVRIHFSEAIRHCWQRAWEASPIPVEQADQALTPSIAIVDMKEFAAADGHCIELRLPVRRTEQAVLTSGVRTEMRGGAMIAHAVAVHAGDSPVKSHASSHVKSLEPSVVTLPTGAAGADAAASDRSLREWSSVAGAAPSPGSGAAGLRAVPTRAARSERLNETPKERPAGRPGSVLQVEERGRFGLAGEPSQGELPFSFESFIVGPCNALAREAALALARRRQSSLNQLYLGGDSGMGKTHLARAAAAEARRQGTGSTSAVGYPSSFNQRTGSRLAPSGSRAGIVYTTAEQFTSEFVSAMRNGRSEDFQKRYRAPIGLLIVEDVQFFDGRMKTQLELFHTVQHVLDAGGRVLLTGDRAPRDLKGLSDRMRTQLARGFVAELERPDAIVRRHILRAKAAAGGVHLPADCLDLLVESTGGSVRDVESVLIQVVTTASLLGRPIDLSLSRDAIARKSGTASPLAPRRVATSEIVRIVAAFFGKRPESLASRSRRRDVLVPRQLAMYLAHRYTDASFAEIGRSLGRDHPSVRNAIGRVERLVLENAPLRYQLEALSERVDQTLASRRSAPISEESERA